MMNEVVTMNCLAKGLTLKERNKIYYEVRLGVIEKLKEGMSYKEISELFDVNSSYVSRIKKDYETNGIAALQIYEHGKPWGKEGSGYKNEKLASRGLMGLV